MRAVGFLLLVVSGLGWGCQTYSSQLSRVQSYYEQNHYEQALAVLRNIEGEQDSLDDLERVRYAYLRGMTDYRLELPDDARYWLAIARAADKRSPGALEADERGRLEATLRHLNAQFYGLVAEPDATTGPGAGAACTWSSECEPGFTCQEKICTPVSGPGGSALEPTTTPPEHFPARP